jgi:autotransporter-associated beta strand protein
VNYSTLEPVTLNGTGPDGALGNFGALDAFAGANTFAGPVTLASASEIGAQTGASLNLSGTMTGAFGVTKVGGGVVNYSAAKTYTGTTTVNAGTLVFNAAHNGTGTGAGAITVNANGSIGGTGPITLASAANLTLAGNISPGSSPGTMTVTTSGGGVTQFAAGGSYNWEINAQAQDGGVAGGPVGWDLLNVSAVSVTATSTVGQQFTIKIVSLNGSTPGPTPGWRPGSPTNPKTFTIASGPAGAFNGVDLTKFAIDTSQFQDAYPTSWSLSIGNSGGSLDLVYVPEPSSVTVGLVMVGGAMLRRRRRMGRA